MQQSVRNMCAKFKVDSLIRFRQVFTTKTLSRNSSNHEKRNIKFPLNTLSDQITICQISFETIDVEQIDTRAKK